MGQKDECCDLLSKNIHAKKWFLGDVTETVDSGLKRNGTTYTFLICFKHLENVDKHTQLQTMLKISKPFLGIIHVSVLLCFT